MRRRFHIIGNAMAGRGRTHPVTEVGARLTAAGAEVHHSTALDEVTALEEARSLVVAGGIDAVIAAGGDGTIRLAAKAVAGSDVALGVVPLGTGNVLAHEVGLPEDPAAIAHLLLAGEARPVRTGLANGDLFLLMAGIGFDGRVIAALDHAQKVRLGKLAYIKPVLDALTADPDRLDVTIDGLRRQASWVIVTKASRYGGRFVLTRGTRLMQPGLVAVLFHGATLPQRVGDLIGLASGSLDWLARLGEGRVTIVPCRRVEVSSAMPVPAQIDGDAFGTTPLVVEIGTVDVRLILPSEPVLE